MTDKYTVKGWIVNVKSERFEMRLEANTITRIDAWRGRKGGHTSRAEAMRQLVELGLERSEQPLFSSGEKLIVSMLCDLLSHHKVTTGVDPDFVSEALHGGHYWSLEWEYPGIYHDHTDRMDVVRETLNFIDMWSQIERFFHNLTPNDKNKVKIEAEPFGENVKYWGFDGNTESEQLNIARFFIEKMDRFAEFKGRDLDAHLPVLDTYRRMWTVYEQLAKKNLGLHLGASGLIAILKECIHPQYRI